MDIHDNENLIYVNEDPGEKRIHKGNVVFLCLTVCFCFIIGVGGFVNFIAKDRDFSESENRVLASFPKLTLSSIADGTFMKNFETYMSDQFVLRDRMISLKSYFDRLSGLRESNGVYIADDGFLIEKPSKYTAKKAKAMTKSINSFMEKYPEITKMVAISPNASYIYSEKLPSGIELHSQYSELKGILNRLEGENYSFLNVTKALKNAKEKSDVFYRTDHHWTTRGAYAVFKAIADKWNLDRKSVEYEFLTVSSDFEGTLASKTGIHDNKDKIEICLPENSEGSYIVSYESQDKRTTSLFEPSKLQQKNKYEVFLGGNYDKVVIDTVSKSRATLLIIKDSYANCLIPMLTPYFAKIIVVDPRYMTESVHNVMDEYNFSHVLFLYNLNTFLQDTSLEDALK
ncbi:MAG: hypothetical protein IKJ70_04465 [Clostridia bacterium]|nr:hypothetical protein [Clostridia bacterium]